MTTLTEQLEIYLKVRCSLGYDLTFAGRVLRNFTGFADANGVRHLSTKLFLQWKSVYGNASAQTWANRLGMVRQFAKWLAGVDAQTEIPPTGLIAAKRYRTKPYIYTPEQITDLVRVAGLTISPYGLQGQTLSTTFGLIAVTGMRISEALRLTDQDVDLEAGKILIRESKKGSDRALPLSPCAINRLKQYKQYRCWLLGACSETFFQKETGKRLTDCTARYHFARVSQLLCLREQQPFNQHGQGPRIHDLRHTFAVHTLINWYRQGLDVEREIPRLSAYLGHTKPAFTYWYIEAVPELLQLASERATRNLNMDGEQV